MPLPKQKDHRRQVDVGEGLSQVSPVAYWYRQGHFATDDEARGAFKLAYQQGMDGMGLSVAHWMGLTEPEYDAWIRDDALPETRGKR